MENFGLATYLEKNVFNEKNVTLPSTELLTVRIIAHEIAHQVIKVLWVCNFRTIFSS